MDKNRQLIQLRSKKLGLLIYDARTAARRSAQECADAIGIPVDQYQAYERGEKSPSLPELENLAFYFDVPLEHFWSAESISSRRKAENIEQIEQLRKIRNRVIGATIRMGRAHINLASVDLCAATSIPEDTLAKYESGEQAVPLPELELLSRALQGRLDDFIDQKGPVGKWRREKVEVERLLQLPPEMRTFLSQPVNQPYITLAIRLSQLSVDKLRSIAEALLEITF